MICESCDCEMRIVGSTIKVTGDNSPDTETKLYRVQTFKCRNKNCPHPQEKVIETELEHV